MSSNVKNHLKAVSCAECRRLKLKCDRVFPCASCRKRGCEALCPNGSLPTRPRAVFQETERLKNRISVLTDRVHDLETALYEIHVRVSPRETHPLLSEELRAVARAVDDQGRDEEVGRKSKSREGDTTEKPCEKVPDVQEDEEVGEIKEGLGTLALHSDGRSKFYGQTAGIESLFHSDFHDHEHRKAPVRYSSPVSASNVIFGPPAWLGNDPAWISGPRTHGDDQPSGSAFSTEKEPTGSTSSGSRLTTKASWTPNWFTHPLPAEMISEVMVRLERQLPDTATAWALSETYFEYAAWLHSSIPRQEFFSEIFSRVYDSAHTNGSFFHLSETSSPNVAPNGAPGLSARVSPEKASILFMVFAIGSLLDLTVPAYHPPTMAQAEHFHELACSALGIAGIVERGSVSCVQALMTMAYYHLLLDGANSPQRSWTLIGLSIRISQCIGLHRDSGWWNSNPEDVQRRRNVFWELFAFERFQSLTLGLSPSLSLQHIDCEFPEDAEPMLSATGETEPGFLWSKRKWIKDIISDLVDALLTTPKKPVPYQKILALDRRLRDDLIQHSKGLFDSSTTEGLEAHLIAPTMQLTLQRIVNVIARETALLLLHRLYLARALNGMPKNVLGSKYGPSVLASCRSASRLVQMLRSLTSTGSALPSRLWFLWNHLMGAVIVLAALASRNPWCTLAPGALRELDASYVLFEHWANSGGSRPVKALEIVGRLRDKAHRVFDDTRKQAKARIPGFTPAESGAVNKTPCDEQPSEELGILSGGRGVKEIPAQQPSRGLAAAPPPPGISDIPDLQPNGQGQIDTASTSHASSPGNIFDILHPELMQDLQAANKENEANFPGMDWSFNDLASWNNIQATSSVPAVDASMAETLAWQYGTAPVTMGSTNTFGFDPTYNIMEGVDAAAEDGSGMNSGGVLWDASWQPLMDQLGVAESSLGQRVR